MGRAHSAVPLHHGKHSVALIGEIAAHYRANGLRPVFRLPDGASFDAWHEALTAQGYQRRQPTQVLVGHVADLLAVAEHADDVTLSAAPDSDWMAMFLGEGLDPVDGAYRSQALARAKDTLFASLREQGKTLCCGAACYASGWLSMHGLRTALPHRGRGLAGRLIHAMAREARHRSIDRSFLQVDAANEPAQALYRRAGMSLAWTYAYWSPASVDC